MKVVLLGSLNHPQEKMVYVGLSNVLGEDNFKVIDPISALTSHVKKLIDKVDVILLLRDMFQDDQVERNLRTLLNQTLKDPVKIAIIDVQDDPLIHRAILNDRINAYFKRELFHIRSVLHDYGLWFSLATSKSKRGFLSPLEILGVYNSKKICPLPLTYIEDRDYTPLKEKHYSVSYVANLPGRHGGFRFRMSQINVYKERIQTARALSPIERSYVRLGVGFATGLSHKEYMRVISQSLSSVATRGNGYDTHRYWEIPYAGSVLLAKYPKTIIPNNFANGKHAFFYKDLRELKAIIRFLANNADQALKIGEMAREFAIKYHSPAARAQVILTKMKED